jgi:outer membrane receptor for ferrienterochelin and colicins
MLCLSTGVLADNGADEADVAFSLGNSAFAKKDFDKALSHYFLSYRLVPNRNVLFNIARCYEATGENNLAWRYWHDVSQEALSPADRRDVDAALNRLTPQVALLSVDSNPPGATVFLDRKDLGSRGKTPQVFAVSAGKHSLILELGGHKNTQLTVVAEKGKSTSTKAQLEPILSAVTFLGTPLGSAVTEQLNGVAVGALPCTVARPAGLRVFIVRAPGYLDEQVVVDVKENQNVEMNVALKEKQKPTGKIAITANRENATVKVNGTRTGFTPTVLTLPEGDYDIEVSTDEVVPVQKHVTVTANSETVIAATLRFAAPKVTAASTRALSVDDAPASVTVLSRDELRGFGYQTVADALRGVRGFFLADDRVYTYVGARGFSPAGDLNTRILVLYDGHPMNDVWAGQGFAARDLDVDLNEVERLEIVRGPASILYGTGAFFGVINVVTRKTIGTKKNIEAVAGAGEQNGVKARATGSVETDVTSLLVSAAGFISEGAVLTDLQELGTVKGLDGERSLGASTKATFKGLSLTGKINQRRKQVPTAPFGSALGLPGTEYTDARGFAELKYENDFGKISILAKASYDGSRYRGYFAQQGSARNTDSGGGDWFSAGVKVGIQLVETNRLTVGVDAQAAFVLQQPTDLAPQKQNRFLVSATLLDEWQLHPRVFLQAGVRIDRYFDLPEFAFSPRIALVARPYNQGLTKVVAGRAFRAPTIYETYFNDNNRTLRAPDVAPKSELITTLEIEHSHNFTEEFRVTLGGYVNFIEALVQRQTDSFDVPRCDELGVAQQCEVYTNAKGSLTAVGAETEIRWQPSRFTIVDGAYSFVWLTGTSVPSYPSHLGSLRVMIPLSDSLLRISTQATYQSGRLSNEARIGESLLLNAGFSGEYGVFRYFAGIQNLLDAKYVLPVSSESSATRVPQYGRTFWIEAAFSY